MYDELIGRARGTKLWKGSVLELAAAMPASDEEVGRLLAGLVAARDNEAFVPLLLAALQAGRRVDAAVLVEGAALLPSFPYVVGVAWKLAGDVGEALVKAAERRAMGTERVVICLLLAVVWYEREGRQASWPRALGLARTIARNPMLDWADRLTLGVMAELTNDKGLRAALGPELFRQIGPHAAMMQADLLRGADEGVLALVPEEPPPNVVSGYTMRRAVARIGRNEPCPCGSGKKYKHCCLGKDHERLAHSSSVPGLTVEELKEQRERYLTREQLRALRSYELVKLDPAKLDPGLLGVLVYRLLDFCEHGRLVEVFEQVGWSPPIDRPWLDALHLLAMDGRADLVRRLVRLKPGFDASDPTVTFNVRFPLLEGSDQSVLDAVEAEAALAVRAGTKSARLAEIAYALLASRYPHLGILVARGVLPVVGSFEAEMLHHTLHDTRDRLQLDYGDPIDRVLEMCEGEALAGGSEGSEELAQARQNIEEKTREVRHVREELERVRAELDRRLATSPPPAVPVAAPAVGAGEAGVGGESGADEVTQGLRRRVEELREQLKDRHSERNALRRELQKAREDLETMKESKRPAEVEVGEGGEQGRTLFEEVTFESNQPVRVPEYGERFREALAEVAKPVARAAMLMVGRLAAGQPAAFVGLKKLESKPEVVRQRVGAHYRLLFRLGAGTLHVVALVNRRDLEKEIRNLFGGR